MEGFAALHALYVRQKRMFSVTQEDLDEAVRDGLDPAEIKRLEILWNRKERLVGKIRGAFDGVTLGDGIGLLEADAWDMCVNPEEPKEARKRDEREFWQKIPESDLSWGGFSQKLCFTDAEGFRFLIPAFLLAELNTDCLYDETLLHLSNRREDKDGKYSLLNASQLGTIVDYLRLHLDTPSSKFFHTDIAESLQALWIPMLEKTKAEPGAAGQPATRPE